MILYISISCFKNQPALHKNRPQINNSKLSRFLYAFYKKLGARSEKIQFKNKKQCFLRHLLSKEPILFRTRTHSLFTLRLQGQKRCRQCGSHVFGKSGFPDRLCCWVLCLPTQPGPEDGRAYLHSSALGSPITELAGLNFRGEREAPGGYTTSLNLFSSPRTPAG